jgi:hypothetical protein
MDTPTRRDVFRLAGGLGVLAILGGCERHRTPTTPDSGELLQVATNNGLAVLDTGAGKTVVAPGAALATRDRRRLVNATADGGGTRITVCDASDAGTIAEATVRGALSPRALTSDASLVALVEGEAADVYRPRGRTSTTIVVAGATGERNRISLSGCVEPEAFSTDRGRLYVLDYLPPQQPVQYRVRALDLASGVLVPLLTRLKQVVPEGAEEAMRGEGRQAVFDGPRQQLFTLYTHQPDHEHTRDLINAGAREGKPDVHAFVHTLSLELGWAYCIDLPDPFGTGPAEGHAIALSPSGTMLFVVDAGSGAVASLDPNPDALTVRRVARFAPVSGAASACFGPDARRLYIAAGTHLLSVDTNTLAVAATWTLPAPARGVAVGASAIYVGQPDAIAAVDPANGAVTRTFPAPALVTAIGLVG